MRLRLRTSVTCGAEVDNYSCWRNDRLSEEGLGLPPALRCESGREPAERGTTVDNDRGSQVIGGPALCAGVRTSGVDRRRPP